MKSTRAQEEQITDNCTGEATRRGGRHRHGTETKGEKQGKESKKSKKEHTRKEKSKRVKSFSGDDNNKFPYLLQNRYGDHVIPSAISFLLSSIAVSRAGTTSEKQKVRIIEQTFLRSSQN